MSTGFAALDAIIAPKPAGRLTSGWRAIDSPYTDAQAAEACRRIPASNTSAHQFANSLADDFGRYGANLTPGKRFWLHQHAMWQAEREERAANAERLRQEAEERAQFDSEPPPSKFDAVPHSKLPALAAFLAGARQRGKGVATTLAIERGPITVQFRNTTPNKTRWPDGFLLVGVFGFERANVPLALIDAVGNLYWSDEGRLISDMHVMLEMMEENPVQFVIENRGARNWCCFCRRDLTDPVSVTMGYGPICAGRWALPHSNEAAAALRAQRAGVSQDEPPAASFP